MASPKLSPFRVLSEGFLLGAKNFPSLLGASVLYILTLWIPYVNVGTTIAINSIPVALSRGKVVSPTFIFEGKYRKFMGEYFTLFGLKAMSLVPAFLFMVVPGIIISISWSQALYIMIDQQVAPGEALVRSNKATYGYKWAIFGIYLLLFAAVLVALSVFSWLGFLGSLLTVALVLLLPVFVLGVCAVIYRNLTQEAPAAQAPVPPVR